MPTSYLPLVHELGVTACCLRAFSALSSSRRRHHGPIGKHNILTHALPPIKPFLDHIKCKSRHSSIRSQTSCVRLLWHNAIPLVRIYRVARKCALPATAIMWSPDLSLTYPIDRSLRSTLVFLRRVSDRIFSLTLINGHHTSSFGAFDRLGVIQDDCPKPSRRSIVAGSSWLHDVDIASP